MEIEVPDPLVTVHEVNIKVNATEAGGIVGWLNKALDSDPNNLWMATQVREIRDAFQKVSDR